MPYISTKKILISSTKTEEPLNDDSMYTEDEEPANDGVVYSDDEEPANDGAVYSDDEEPANDGAVYSDDEEPANDGAVYSDDEEPANDGAVYSDDEEPANDGAVYSNDEEPANDGAIYSDYEDQASDDAVNSSDVEPTTDHAVSSHDQVSTQHVTTVDASANIQKTVPTARPRTLSDKTFKTPSKDVETGDPETSMDAWAIVFVKRDTSVPIRTFIILLTFLFFACQMAGCILKIFVDTKKYQTLAWYDDIKQAPDPSVCTAVYKYGGDERRGILNHYLWAERMCRMKAMSEEKCQALKEFATSDFDGTFKYRPIPEFFQHLYRYDCLELRGRQASPMDIVMMFGLVIYWAAVFIGNIFEFKCVREIKLEKGVQQQDES